MLRPPEVKKWTKKVRRRPVIPRVLELKPDVLIVNRATILHPPVEGAIRGILCRPLLYCARG